MKHHLYNPGSLDDLYFVLAEENDSAGTYIALKAVDKTGKVLANIAAITPDGYLETYSPLPENLGFQLDPNGHIIRRIN